MQPTPHIDLQDSGQDSGQGEGPMPGMNGRRSGDGHRERRDVATGEVRPDSEMVRVVRGPDDVLVPDILAKLPGRGAWVGATRGAVEAAIAAKAFHRSFKGRVVVPEGFADQIAELLKRRALGLISMGMKGGRIAVGFDQVRGLSRTQPISWRIEASDGSPDGRSKIRTLAKAVSRELEVPLPKVAGCFTAEELGAALGRTHAVHIAIAPGPLAASFGEVMGKYSGFAPLVPPDWPDVEHEDGTWAARQKT